jgi:hypothetical protein
VHTFYRQGGTVKTHCKDPSDLSHFQYQRITDYDLGAVFVYKCKIMVSRSSEHILFFKLDEDEDNPGTF